MWPFCQAIPVKRPPKSGGRSGILAHTHFPDETPPLLYDHFSKADHLREGPLYCCADVVKTFLQISIIIISSGHQWFPWQRSSGILSDYSEPPWLDSRTSEERTVATMVAHWRSPSMLSFDWHCSAGLRPWLEKHTGYRHNSSGADVYANRRQERGSRSSRFLCSLGTLTSLHFRSQVAGTVPQLL